MQFHPGVERAQRPGGRGRAVKTAAGFAAVSPGDARLGPGGSVVRVGPAVVASCTAAALRCQQSNTRLSVESVCTLDEYVLGERAKALGVATHNGDVIDVPAPSPSAATVLEGDASSRTALAADSRVMFMGDSGMTAMADEDDNDSSSDSDVINVDSLLHGSVCVCARAGAYTADMFAC